ncbi:MAG: hypoxanthine phosphoribosyltransferase [Tannerella sp.]|nr:hypoxanthine phosphoribosyltransferase [Tannerella sp.]
MQTIRLSDKDFELHIPEQKILQAIDEMARMIRQDVEGTNPLFVGILNGAYMFAAELMSRLPPFYELTFAGYSSYQGTRSAGYVQETLPIKGDIRNRPVILLEDIIDSGLTMQCVTRKLHDAGAKDVKLATLLLKPDALKCDLKPDYVGLETDSDFIVGFGLDYNGLGRSCRNIYKIKADN